MTAVLSPVSMPGPSIDMRAHAGQAQGTSPPARATALITAVAPRPVDAASSARDARSDATRDKPVGPPPAFEINVLQDMRATQRTPDSGTAGTDIPPEDPPTPTPAYAESRTDPDPTIDRKV